MPNIHRIAVGVQTIDNTPHAVVLVLTDNHNQDHVTRWTLEAGQKLFHDLSTQVDLAFSDPETEKRTDKLHEDMKSNLVSIDHLRDANSSNDSASVSANFDPNNNSITLNTCVNVEATDFKMPLELAMLVLGYFTEALNKIMVPSDRTTVH